jgi:hypothetical protein
LTLNGPASTVNGADFHDRNTRPAAERPPAQGVIEHKYCVKGVSNVRTIMVKGGAEEERLVSITRSGYVWRLQIRSSPTCSKPSRR